MALGIKVPVQVDALVVGRNVGSGWSGPTGATAPFANGSPLPAGIHLHWALPDALVTGDARERDESASGVDLPAVPDLWIVTRFGPAAANGIRPSRSWVVDSRTEAVTPLTSTWQSPAVEAGRPKLTAAGFFDASGRLLNDQPVNGVRAPADVNARAQRAAWAAYYPDAGKRFGFHDPLEGNVAGPVSYTVVGWYSALNDDPLHAAGDAQARLEWLRDARWTAPGISSGGAADDTNLIVPREIREIPVLVPIGGPGGPIGGPIGPVVPIGGPIGPGGPLGPGGPVGVPVRPGTPVVRDPRIGDTTVGRPERPIGVDPAAPRSPTTDVEMAPSVSGNIAANFSRLINARGGIRDLIAGEQTGPAVASAVTFSPQLVERLSMVPDAILARELSEQMGTVPDRIYCHGSVYDLPARGGGGTFDAAAPVTVADTLTWTLGDSVGECLARVIEPDGGVPSTENRRWLFHAAASARLGSVQQLGELPRMQQYLHEQGFRSENTGFDEVPARESQRSGPLAFANGIDATKLRELMRRLGLPTVVGEVALRLREDAAMRPLGVSLLMVIAQFVRPQSRRGPFGGVLFDDAGGTRALTADVRELFEKLATDGARARGSELKRAVEQFMRQIERRGIDPMRGVAMRRIPRPRAWRAHAPQICVMGVQRGLRHFQDGRFDATGEEMLVCRLTGQSARTLALGNATLTAGSFWPDAAEVRVLPATAQELIRETVLLDPVSASGAAGAATRQGLSITRPEVAFRFESTFWWNSAWSPQATSEVSATTGYSGTLPSLVGVRPWRRAWNPLFLEYDVDYIPANGTIASNFALGEVEHTPKGALTFGAPMNIQGRALLTPTAAESLSSALMRAAKDASAIAANQQEAFRRAAEAANALDVVTASIEGIDRRIRDAGGDLRAGALQVRRLRVVDAFGQVQTLAVNQPVIDSDDLVTVGQGVKGWLLPPRLTKRARLDFRFVRASDGQAEANASSSPVCGWLMLDHIEHAVEVFDARGTSLGQLYNDRQNRAAWEPAPGSEAAWGGAVAEKGPDGSAVNPALRRFVAGVLDADWNNTRPPDSESAVSALVRLLDTVRQTVDRAGESADQLAQLADRPIAIVRATVGMSLYDEGATAGAPTSPRDLPPGVEVRLGSLTQPDDGLLAWCRADTLTELHAPHESARTNARTSGRRAGRLAGSTSARTQPIQHRYVSAVDSLPLPTTATIELLLLLEAGAGVHATAGVVPRKKLRLEDAWTSDVMRRMGPTLRVGPVIVDPANVGMPVPAVERFKWYWSRRVAEPGTPDNWSDQPVEARADEAIMPAARIQMHEGWLKPVFEE
ncbi:MAG: hypothetical protein U0326_30030 [Polyangiales bacterium]